ncbi:MAG: putative metal-binding motif-containing protein, partial [Myxococcota bacterium]
MKALSDQDGDGYRPEDGDCNDNDPSIHPGMEEVCGEPNQAPVDENCDGQINLDAIDIQVW